MRDRERERERKRETWREGTNVKLAVWRDEAGWGAEHRVAAPGRVLAGELFLRAEIPHKHI
jgi:hypothetical protein